MMVTTAELVLLLLICFLVFSLHKLPDISRGLARLRLHFDKGVAEDYIEATPDDGGNGTGATDSDDNRGA